MDHPRSQPIGLDELRTALESALSNHFGAPRPIRVLRRRRCAYSSSATIVNLEVGWGRGRGLRLVLKDLSPNAMVSAARHIRPGFLIEPRREVEVYRRILGPAQLGTPVCYGATIAPELDRYWLFLERVPGPMLWQCGRLEAWEEAARWLAGLQVQGGLAKRNANRGVRSHLLRYDQAYFEQWLPRAEQLLRRSKNAPSPQARRRFRRLADRYGRVVQRIMELPRALVHGEFYPSNILVRSRARRPQVCPVDWEMAGFAPAPMDLAALTSGTWGPEEKRRMVAAYVEAADPTLRQPGGVAELLEAVEWCQLHLAIQWLGWAADWSPPQLHARDWLGEALCLAKRLGV